MIDTLRVGETANFYSSKKELTSSAISALFRDLRSRTRKPSRNIFLLNRQQVGAARMSAISFSHEMQPTFLTTDAGVVDRISCFLLIVEHRSHVAVFKSGIELPAKFASIHLGRVSSARLELAVAGADAVFERIRLRNMSLSKSVMRSKTLEADDLQTAVGPASSSRYVPRGYSVRQGADFYSATPSTGRIAKRSDRVGYLQLVAYSVRVIDLILDSVGAPAPFIDGFARSVESSALGSNVPVSFAVDVARLKQALHEDLEIRLTRTVEGVVEALTTQDSLQLIDALGLSFAVAPEGESRECALYRIEDDVEVGSIALNKSRIALKRLELANVADVEVERTAYPLGEDPERLALRRFIDRADLFIVLFEDISLAYIDGALFRDPGITDGGQEFLRYLKPEPLLVNVINEKGAFAAGQVAFDLTSTFGVVVESTSLGEETLICDDIHNEWADFIGVSNTSNPPRISFYHAKAGNLSLGASPFHEAVGQALKNLNNMNFPSVAMPAKLEFWGNTYNNDGVQTQIPRTIRTTVAGVAHEIDAVRKAPDTIRRVFVVTSSLSIQAVSNQFVSIAAGNKPNPYFVQLYWLLMSYFSACAEMNSQGYVVCRP